MPLYIEWDEPLASQPGLPLVNVRCQALASEIIAFQMAREPRYTSGAQALEDFCVVHWAKPVEIAD